MNIQKQIIHRAGIGYAFFFVIDGMNYRGHFAPARGAFSDAWKIVNAKPATHIQADVYTLIKSAVSDYIAG